MARLTSEDEVRAYLRTVVPGACIVEDFNPEVEEIISMCRSTERLSRLSLDDLTNFLVVLGHHLIYLDTTYTTYRMMHTSLKTDYEYQISALSTEISAKGTVAEKEAQVLKQHDYLWEMREQMKRAELLKHATENLTKTMLEYINTLKRKQDVMELEAQNQYRTAY